MEPEALIALRAAAAWRQTHAYPLALVTPGVRNWVGQESSQMVVGQRLKRMPQIVLKLTRFDTMRLSQMEDIAGCRAVLANNAEVEAVGKRIEQKWRVRYRSDYREDGKPGTGYRGVHYVVVRRDRLVEVQLRTNRQHEWAEAVEQTASRTRFDLKDGDGPSELVAYFRAASDVIWAQENGREVDEDLMAEFNELREQVRPYFTRPARRLRSLRRKSG
ncbi:MAG TPA: RelA/SpoT domain-containing protein [Thermoleophilaceae bacterium]|nr:RelA/SpoT domain-containing protein [Thermoleophilaceae bacterium]